MRLLGRLGARQCGIFIVIDVVDNDLSVLGNSLDSKGSFVCLFDDNVHTSGERLWSLALTLTFLLRKLLLLLIHILFISHGAVHVVSFRVHSVQVCDGEGDTDTKLQSSAYFSSLESGLLT